MQKLLIRSLALASLNHTCRNLVPTFPQRSPPSLLTTAACGGLRSTPDCRPRRTYLHLSYSYAAPCGPALLVTQGHFRTHAVHKYRSSEGGHLSRANEAACRQQSVREGHSCPGRMRTRRSESTTAGDLRLRMPCAWQASPAASWRNPKGLRPRPPRAAVALSYALLA